MNSEEIEVVFSPMVERRSNLGLTAASARRSPRIPSRFSASKEVSTDQHLRQDPVEILKTEPLSGQPQTDFVPDKKPNTISHYWNVYLNIVIYSLCLHLWNPLLPYLVKEIGGSTSDFGLLSGWASFAQMVGSVLCGPLIGKLGSRNLLLLSFSASALTYLGCYYASGLWTLALARLFVMFQQALLAARSLVVIQTQSDARMLNYLSIAYSVGGLLGPALSGYILVNNVNVRDNVPSSVRPAAFAASCLSIICFTLISAFGIHEEERLNVKSRVRSVSEVNTSWTLRGLRPFKKALMSHPQILHVLSMKVFLAMATSLFHSMLSITLADKYQLEPYYNGWVFSYIGFIAVLVQFATNVFHSFINKHEDQCLMVGSIAMGLSFWMMSQVETIASFCISVTPAIASASLLFTISTAMLTRHTSREHSGSVVGIDMAISSCQRIISPLLGTWIATHYGYESIGKACALFVLFGIFAQFRKSKTT